MPPIKMMTGNLSPEERLLRVIESGGEAPARPTRPTRVVLWDPRTWSAVMRRYRDQASVQIGRARARFGPGQVRDAFSLARANQGLAVLLVGLVAWVAYDLTRQRPTVQALIAQAEASRTAGTEEPAVPTPRPLNAYLQEADKRDLFSPPHERVKAQPKAVAAKAPPPPAEPAAPSPPPPPPPPTALEILRKKVEGLKLVGIVFGEPPVPVAVIEEKTSGRTYFLKVGDTIQEVKIQNITKRSVIVSYREAQHELF